MDLFFDFQGLKKEKSLERVSVRASVEGQKEKRKPFFGGWVRWNASFLLKKYYPNTEVEIVCVQQNCKSE